MLLNAQGHVHNIRWFCYSRNAVHSHPLTQATDVSILAFQPAERLMWFGCFCMKSCWYTGVYRYLFYIHTTMFSFNTVYAVFQVSMVQKPAVWASLSLFLASSICQSWQSCSEIPCLVRNQPLSYWCVLRREFLGMIDWLTINFIPATSSNPSIPYVKRTSKFWQLPTLPLRYQRRYSQLPVISGHPSESQGWFLFY